MFRHGASLKNRSYAASRRDLGTPAALPAAIAAESGWKLTFREEFGSFSRNSNFSGRDVGQRAPTGTWTTRLPYDETRFLVNPDHNEQQYYADPSHPQNPFAIVNNCLRIRAAPSADTAQSQSKPYVTGMISSDAVHNQLYGYWEIRCKLPEGQGFWPIFWLLTKENSYTSEAYGWPPEIDILESHGDRPTDSHWNVHWYQDSTNWHNTYPPYDGAVHFAQFPSDASNGFVTFGLKWDATNLSWWWGGVKVKEVATPVNMNMPMFMLFTNGIGGEWPNYPDETATFPADTLIDYISVWSNASNASEIAAPPRLIPVMPATPAAAAATSVPAAPVATDVTVANNVNTGAAAGNRAYTHTDGLKRAYQAGPGNDTLTTLSQYGHLYSTPNNGIHTVKTW